MAATVNRVAEACNITRRRVNQLVGQGILPRQRPGQYDLTACMAAYIRYLQQVVKAKGSMDEDGEVTSTKNQRAELLRIQTEKERLELAKLRGEVMSVADHETILSALIIETKARVLAVAPRAAPELVGEGSRVMIQAKLEKALKDALAQLAAVTPVMPPAEDAPEDATEPETPDPEPADPRPDEPPAAKRKRSTKNTTRNKKTAPRAAATSR